MSDVKQIIVFGATGQCGSRILKRALDEGLQVTAFVRTPAKIPEDVKSKLHKVVKGDVTDKEAVEDAICGHDAVLSSLSGALTLRGGDMLLSNSITNIISGMKKHKVKNLIVVSGAFQLPGLLMAIPRFILSRVVTEIVDHTQMLKILQAASNDIDWIAMTPPMIEDKNEVNPDYLVAINETPGKFVATAAEIADFMIKIITYKDNLKTYRHTKVGISSRPSSSYTTPLAILLLAATIGAIMYCMN